jgi:hypothetical protein
MGMGIDRGLHGWVGLTPIELHNCSWNYEVYEIWGLDEISLESMLSGIYTVSEVMSNRGSSRIKSLLPNFLYLRDEILSLRCLVRNSYRTSFCIGCYLSGFDHAICSNSALNYPVQY